jgi:hypothetical protein
MYIIDGTGEQDVVLEVDVEKPPEKSQAKPGSGT